MIVPEWLFELPIIKPERIEFRNTKNDRSLNFSFVEFVEVDLILGMHSQVVPIIFLEHPEKLSKEFQID